MADGIFSGFSGFSNMVVWARYIGIGLLILVGVGAICAMIIFILVKSREKEIEEISMTTRKVKKMAGKDARGKDGNIKIFVGKIRKWLPQIQQEDIFIKKNKEKVYLLRDNNGLHHTLRVPTADELKLWYLNIYGINLDEEGEQIKNAEEEYNNMSDEEMAVPKAKFWARKKFEKREELLHILDTVYFLPNPAEDLNWMAHQYDQADKQFPNVWYKNPTVIMIGTFVLCTFIFIITMIISKKM